MLFYWQKLDHITLLPWLPHFGAKLSLLPCMSHLHWHQLPLHLTSDRALTHAPNFYSPANVPSLFLLHIHTIPSSESLHFPSPLVEHSSLTCNLTDTHKLLLFILAFPVCLLENCPFICSILSSCLILWQPLWLLEGDMSTYFIHSYILSIFLTNSICWMDEQINKGD